MNTKQALDDLKETMLGMSPDISCHGCDKNYCCVGQKVIEISTVEFERIVPLIKAKHRERAFKAIEQQKSTELWDCPFNDPKTGLCDIYDDRFIVCASYGVINKAEHCDSRTEHGLKVVNPYLIFTKIEKPNTLKFIWTAATKGETTSIIDEFKKIV